MRFITSVLHSRGHRICHHNVYYWLKAYDRGDNRIWCACQAKPKVLQKSLIEGCWTHSPAFWRLIPSCPVFASTDHLLQMVPTSACQQPKQAIDAAGFTHSKSRYGQMVRHKNKPLRLEFWQKLIGDNDTFDEVIFSNESSVQTHQNKTNHYRDRLCTNCFREAETPTQSPRLGCHQQKGCVQTNHILRTSWRRNSSLTASSEITFCHTSRWSFQMFTGSNRTMTQNIGRRWPKTLWGTITSTGGTCGHLKVQTLTP